MSCFPFLDDRDFALGLLDADYEAQLRAIHEVLRLRTEADKKFDLELKEIELFAKTARGSASEQAVNERVDHLHGGVFSDAAHSMAAVGMLAPFMESVFHQAFCSIGKLRQDRGNTAAPRAMAKGRDPWDCHFVSDGSKDLLRGILELSDAIGLTTLLPVDLERTLGALFGYRNKMFHHGFEWPPSEREKFQSTIAQQCWPAEWFDKSQSNHKPWIFYMTRVFVDHCLCTIDEIFTGVGAFARQKL